MHPLTVYGIETVENRFAYLRSSVACTLLPFTVLKQLHTNSFLPVKRCMHPLAVYGIETSLTVPQTGIFESCMHPLTVYGIET